MKDILIWRRPISQITNSCLSEVAQLVIFIVRTFMKFKFRYSQGSLELLNQYSIRLRFSSNAQCGSDLHKNRINNIMNTFIQMITLKFCFFLKYYVFEFLSNNIQNSLYFIHTRTTFNIDLKYPTNSHFCPRSCHICQLPKQFNGK